MRINRPLDVVEPP